MDTPTPVASVPASVSGRTSEATMDETEPRPLAGNTLTANEARRNAGRGIEVVEGTSDGSGSRASGTGRSPQCVGVPCL
jgi:hypothetical protein